MTDSSTSDSQPAPAQNFWGRHRSKLLALGLLGAIALGSLPGYMAGGAWRWQRAGNPSQLKTLRQLPKQGLAIPGWQTQPISQRSLGGEQWLWQPIERVRPQGPGATPNAATQRDRAVLLLMPMKRGRDRPQVEWTALDSGNWLGDGLQTDSEQTLTLAPAGLPPFRARLVRLWTSQHQTYFLLSWYAWPQGGDPAPSQWFWRDQLAQWQQGHTPWVAVSLLLPTDKPLDEWDQNYQARLTDLAQQVQQVLLTGPLKPVPPKVDR